MFFEKEIHTVKLRDAIELTRESLKKHQAFSNTNTLSFRYDAKDTVILCDKEKLKAEKGSVTFIPKGASYKLSSTLDREILIRFDILDGEFISPESFVPLNPHKYFQLFKRLYTLCEAKKDGYLGDSTALLYQILAECYKEKKAPEGEHPILKNGLTYLNESFFLPDVSIKEAANRAGISEVYFRRVFGKCFGISPKKYVIEKRIAKAKELIDSGYYSLMKVSSLCGFCDYKHFTTEFKRTTGVSPSKFKIK